MDKPQVPDVPTRLENLLKQIGDAGTCRGCGRLIWWVKHKNGKATPYDLGGETVGVNHFVTCPQRGEFKR